MLRFVILFPVGNFLGIVYAYPMSKVTSREKPATDFPEFVVTRESFNRYFEKPLPTSTFHDLVNSGKITPFQHLRGHYLLNASLRRLGLKEVRELPQPPPTPSLEDIVRLAFSLIDHELFPEPSWIMYADGIEVKDVDHALRLADLHRNEVQSFDEAGLKVNYFQGVLDAAFMMQKSQS